MKYTCNSCELGFESSQFQREHMKSEWHRYNLKRRVAQLPAVSEELFNTKIAAHSHPEDVENQTEKQLTKKEIRRREKDALQEKKRQILAIAREAMLAQQEKSESIEAMKIDELKDALPDVEKKTEEGENGERELTEEKLIEEKMINRVDIPLTTCLFCHSSKNMQFEDIESNIEHMSQVHGLYIPEKKFLKDQEGLLKYLGEKIGFGNVCLCCNYSGKNIEAVREHMQKKRHMKIPYELEEHKLEISDFYDFTSSYASSYPVITDEHGAEEEWEDVSDSESSEDSEILDYAETALYVHNNELHLPNGAVAGHRSLQRYYRQNLAPERILTEGQGTVIAAETRHMYNIKDRQELATQKRAWSRQKKREDINDRRAAKFVNNQPHFRDQLLQ